MAYNRTQVRDLLNSSEFELFELSLAENVKSVPHGRLRAKVTRARALRDKYRDLCRRQKLATRARTGMKTANRRTEVKAVVLAETLNRFEKRMQHLDEAQAREVAKALAAAERSRTIEKNGTRTAKATVRSRTGSAHGRRRTRA
jgi:hypothetical protein